MTTIYEECPSPQFEPLSAASLPLSSPSRFPAADLRASLVRIQSEFVLLGKQEPLDKRRLDALQKEQREVDNELALITYPVFTLPNEIISRIFVACLPSHGRVCPSPCTAPLVLAQICSPWREIALATCTLWSSIFLRPSSSNNGLGARALFECWLSRAKEHPLWLGIQMSYGAISPELMSLISSVSGQIEPLELHLIHEQFLELLKLGAPFPLLRHLVTSYPTSGAPANLQQCIPALREIRLLGETSTVKFSHPLLTRMEIRTTIPVKSFLSILTAFPLLEHLKCSVSDRNATIIRKHKPQTYPHLQSLVLGEGIGSYDEFMCTDPPVMPLNLLTLPNLRRLELRDEVKLSALRALISRSNCVLEHLLICIDDFRGTLITEWLHAFPSVTSLKITFCRDVNLLVACLSPPELLPHLRDLTITGSICSKKPTIDYELVLVFLHRRRTPRATGAKLRSLHLDVCDQRRRREMAKQTWHPQHAFAAELTRFVADGLDFVVQYYEEETEYSWWPDTSSVVSKALESFQQFQ